MYKLELAKFMHKFINNNLPSCFKDYFVEIKHKHEHNTRSSLNNFYVNRKTTVMGQGGLNYLGPRLWLEIPDNVKNKSSFKAFTFCYKKFLIENYNAD